MKKAITPLENTFIETLKEHHYADCYNCDDDLIFFDLRSICDASSMNIKIFRAVLISLVKKNIIQEEYEKGSVKFFSMVVE